MSTIQKVVLAVCKLPYPLVETVKAIVQKNREKQKIIIIFWIITGFSTYVETKLTAASVYSIRSFTLQVLFYIWLQMPLFNGSSIIYNVFAKIFHFSTVPIDTNLGIDPIIKKTNDLYTKIRNALPQPVIDEDSEPSADPSTRRSYR
jgi:hypothetical protein